MNGLKYLKSNYFLNNVVNIVVNVGNNYLHFAPRILFCHDAIETVVGKFTLNCKQVLTNGFDYIEGLIVLLPW